MKKPNIIIFNPDQMRADALGHLGNPAAITPNLDAFSQTDAVSFENAFCQNPVCVPSRCSFMTGLYPHTRGHRTMQHLMHEGESSLFMELKNAGWYVWMNRRNDFLATDDMDWVYQHCDTFFLGGNTTPPGAKNAAQFRQPNTPHYYSFYEGELGVDQTGKNETSDDEAVDEAIRFIRNRPKDQPFCIFLGLFYPHPPYRIEEPYFSAIDRAKLPRRAPKPEDMEDHPKMLQMLHETMGLDGLSEEQWDEIRACYLGMCMKVDESFGRLMNVLREEGLYDETDVYVFSDHGDFTGDYDLSCKAQNLFQDCLTRVPFLVKPHAGVPCDPGVSDAMTELVDFYATAADLAGIESDHDHFGKSLRPTLADRTVEHRQYVFAEGGRNPEELHHCSEAGGGEPDRRDRFWPRKTAQRDNVAHTKATMIRDKQYKYVLRKEEQDEFYDLAKDPFELNNVINDPQYSQEINRMKLAMLDWYQGTCDVVPWKIDVGMSRNVVLCFAENQLKEDEYEKFKYDLDLAAPGMAETIRVCEEYGVRII